ncbi:SH3 domain-containing protein [Roseovarius arcticus]|uniref:SH3 domain-containing protein n=1 Tax=Roseovarius arcticus TaxID=2547404 RepID=UPI00148619AB|nr:SH3 domain-containing protein [Roseovarius arcticus]
MWRFILISFGFLGFAFYQASGGSDYAPAQDSLQVAYQNKSIFAEPKMVPAPVQLAGAEIPEPKIPALVRRDKSQVARTRVTRAEPRGDVTLAGLSGLSSEETGGFGITLASMTRPLVGGDALGTRAAVSTSSFDSETLVNDVRDTPIDEAVVASLPPTPTASDIRSIAGDAANMRSGPGTDFGKVDQLSRGTSVEVLDRRGAWVELRDLNTGQIGWMADWLVTAAN